MDVSCECSNACFPPRRAPLVQNHAHMHNCCCCSSKNNSVNKKRCCCNRKNNSTGRRCCVPITSNNSDFFWLALTFLVIMVHALSPAPAGSRHTSHASDHGEMKLPPLARRRASLQHRACSRHAVLPVLLSPSMLKERSSPGMSTQPMKNLQEVSWWQRWFR